MPYDGPPGLYGPDTFLVNLRKPETRLFYLFYKIMNLFFLLLACSLYHNNKSAFLYVLL